MFARHTRFAHFAHFAREKDPFSFETSDGRWRESFGCPVNVWRLVWPHRLCRCVARTSCSRFSRSGFSCWDRECTPASRDRKWRIVAREDKAVATPPISSPTIRPADNDSTCPLHATRADTADRSCSCSRCTKSSMLICEINVVRRIRAREASRAEDYTEDREQDREDRGDRDGPTWRKKRGCFAYLFRDNEPGVNGNSGVSLTTFRTNSMPLKFVTRNSRPFGFADTLVTIPRRPITNWYSTLFVGGNAHL